MTNRTYVSFATGYSDDGGILNPGNAIYDDPNADAIPISVLDGTRDSCRHGGIRNHVAENSEKGDWNYTQTGVTITGNPVNGRLYVNTCGGTNMSTATPSPIINPRRRARMSPCPCQTKSR